MNKNENRTWPLAPLEDWVAVFGLERHPAFEIVLDDAGATALHFYHRDLLILFWGGGAKNKMAKEKF